MDLSNSIEIFGSGTSNTYVRLAYLLRGEMYSEVGSDHCFDDFQSAINLEPGDFESYLHRGDAYARKSMYAEAVADYNMVVKLNPTNALAYSGRGLMLAHEGNYAKGIDDCYKGIRCEPTCGMAFARLAWLLAVGPEEKLRDGPKAVEYANKACELTGFGKPECINSLAAADAEVGHFEDAVKWLNKCTEFDHWPEKDSDEFRSRLDLYSMESPFMKRSLIEGGFCNLRLRAPPPGPLLVWRGGGERVGVAGWS